MRLIYLMIILSLFLSGCTPPLSIEEKAIISMAGFDKKDNKIQVTAFIQNPAVLGKARAGAQKDERPVSILKTEGNTIDFAVHWSSNFVPRHVDWNHMQVVILGEELAEEGISHVLDFIQRQPEASTLPFIFICKGITTRELFERAFEFTDSPSRYIQEIIAPSREHTNFREVRVYNLLNDLNSPLTDIVVNGIRLAKKKHYVTAGGHETFYITNTLGVLKHGKLAGWMDKKASSGYMWVKEDRWDHAVELKNERYKVYVNHDITTNKPDIKVNFRGKDIKNIEIEVDIESKISEISHSRMPLTTQTIHLFEKDLEVYVEERVRHMIEVSQKMGADILGLGYQVRKANQKYWEQYKTEWAEKIYPRIHVDVIIHVQVENTGDIVEKTETNIENK